MVIKCRGQAEADPHEERVLSLWKGEGGVRIDGAPTAVIDAEQAMGFGQERLDIQEYGNPCIQLPDPLFAHPDKVCKLRNDRVRVGGVYARAVEHLKTASQPPIIHMTLSRLNQDSLNEFARHMMKLPVKGIGFSFYTPDRSTDDSDLFIPLKERDRLVMELLSLRKRYGEKIGFTPAMARQLLTTGDFFKWNRYADCPVSRHIRCFKSNGHPKACTYGDSADCSRCGCAAVAAYRGAFKPVDYPTLRLILGLMIPELRVREG
jgi:MoaA/NifB/PqqE/SkfB family radical SAM enzyme